MGRIEYEQSLVETAVFLAVRKDEHLECALHLAIDPLYEIPDEELRQRAFVPVFREFFTSAGLDNVVADLMAERSLLQKQVDRCIVREAPRRRNESAELFLQEGGNEAAARCTLVIQACPQSLVDSDRFVPRMRRELLHVADMLDERFGYERESLTGHTAHQSLVRDRYRILWDIYVEGRLGREGWGISKEVARLQQAIGRVFVNDPACLDSAVFHRLFDASSVTHPMLLDWARNPEQLFDPSGTSPVSGRPAFGAIPTTLSAASAFVQPSSQRS